MVTLMHWCLQVQRCLACSSTEICWPRRVAAIQGVVAADIHWSQTSRLHPAQYRTASWLAHRQVISRRYLRANARWPRRQWAQTSGCCTCTEPVFTYRELRRRPQLFGNTEQRWKYMVKPVVASRSLSPPTSMAADNLRLLRR